MTAKKTRAATARYKNLALHSAYDPHQEALNTVKAVEKDTFDSIVLIGAGLGYALTQLTQRYRDTPLLCVEYDAALFASLLHQWRYPRPEAHGTHTFFVMPQPTDISEYLRERGLRKPRVVQSHIAKRFFEPQHMAALCAELDSYQTRVQVNDNTLEQFSRLWQSNTVRNCTWYAPRLTSLSALQHACSNHAALLCCAGPSLYGGIPHIQALAPHMLVVAVDTAVAPLLQHGIIPDFICSVDPQYINTQHLHWHSAGAPHYLIDLAASPRLFQLAPRESSFFVSKPTMPLAQALCHGMDFDAEIHSGGSVATFAWDALRYMGITRIYSVGLDLSYPLHASHSRGCSFENAVHQRSTRTACAENALYRSFNAAPLRAVPAYNNKPVLTDARLMVYHQWFATIHKRFPHMRTYTFCKEAARIPAVQHCEVDAVLQEMRRGTAKNARQDLAARLAQQRALSQHGALPHGAPQAPQTMRQNAQHLCKTLEAFARLCARAQQLAHKLMQGTSSAHQLQSLQRIERQLLQDDHAHKQVHSQVHSQVQTQRPSAAELVGFFLQKDIQNILTHGGGAAPHDTAPQNTTGASAHKLYKRMHNCAHTLHQLVQQSLAHACAQA